MYSLASSEPDSCHSSFAPAEARIRSGQTWKSASLRQFGALVSGRLQDDFRMTKSTQRAREQSDFVIPSEPKILRLVRTAINVPPDYRMTGPSNSANLGFYAQAVDNEQEDEEEEESYSDIEMDGSREILK